MALNVGELNATLNIDTSDYNKGLKSAEKAAERWGITTEKSATQVSSKFGTVLNVVKGAAIGFGAALFGAGIAGIKMAGDMQKISGTFEVLLGSASAATAMMEDLKTFAATTPFEFPEVATAAKNLLALGIAAENIPSSLQALGDIAAGVNIPFGELADIYGKMNVQGRVFAEDINQLQGRGIPIVQELAKQFGVSTTEINKMVSEGKIGFPEIEKAFKSLTGEGGKFQGMMQRLSSTLPGLLSTMTDNIKEILIIFGKNLIDAFDLNKTIENFNKQMGKFIESVKKSGLSAAFLQLFPPEAKLIIVGIAGALITALVPALVQTGIAATRAAVGFIAANAAMLPILLIGASIATLAYLIYANWEGLMDLFEDIGTVMVSNMSKAWSDIKIIILKGAQAIVDAWVTLYGWLPIIGDKFKTLQETVNNLTKSEEEVGSSIQSTTLASVRQGKQFTFQWDITDKLKKITEQYGEKLNDTSKNQKNTTESAKELTQSQKDIFKTMSEVDSKLKSIDNEYLVYGKNVDVAARKTDVIQKSMVELLNNGLSPTSEEFKLLQSQLNSFEKINKFTTSLTNLKNTAGNLGLNNIAGSIGKINTGFTTLTNSISQLKGKSLSNIFGDTKSIESLSAGIGVLLSGWNAIKKATTSVKTITVDLTTIYVSMSDSFKNSVTTLSTGLQDARQKTAAVSQISGTVLATFQQIADVINKGIGDAFTSSAKSFLTGQNDMLTALRDGVKNAIIDAITTSIIQGTILKGAIGGLLTQLTEQLALGLDVTGTISQIGSALPAVAAQMEKILSPIKSAISSAFPESTTTTIPAMANGGIVSRPTMALIGEAGPEAVVPLSQMGSIGGQQTIIIQLDGKTIGRAAVENMPSYIRMKTGVAL